jgi:uncharacterized protein with PQ loop repeat
MTLANLAVLLATVMAWWSLIPQIRKLLRTSDPAGVSGTFPAIGLVSNVGWTAYLLSQQLWAAAPATTVMVLFYAAVLRALRKAEAPIGWALIRGAVSMVILVIAYMWGSWAVLGLVLGWAYAPQLAPAVWAAYRTVAPTGISTGTWTLIGIEAGLWMVYGALLRDTPVMIFAAIGLVGALLILARVWWTIGFRGSEVRAG